MTDDARHHISAVAGRSASETSHLVARMQRFCWPGGATDRTEPGALAWVRRWRPTPLGAPVPVCSCTQGRCLMCN